MMYKLHPPSNSMPAKSGRVEKDFRKRDEGKRADAVS
jgi:hypothetical protein